MFTRISNSWNLFKASLAVLRADKELLVFPVVSAIGVIAANLAFIIPFMLGGLFDNLALGGFPFFGYVFLFIFYVAQYAAIYFINTALVGAALIRLRGGDPTLRDGFRIASGKLVPILGYAAIAATVGIILRQLSNQKKGFGRFIASLLGAAWSIATFLVVPVLAAEDTGPIAAIQRSVELLKKTWGEQIAGNLSINAVMGLAYFATFLGGIGATIFTRLNNLPLLVTGAVAVPFLLLFLSLAVVGATLNGIFSAAVYQFATAGETSAFFPAELVQHAFRPADAMAAL
ncbi:MAG: DUF6159 family protein [Anaerolineae bacterium]|nr:DUF6159 family protein [Anaerolineae bacterium]